MSLIKRGNKKKGIFWSLGMFRSGFNLNHGKFGVPIDTQQKKSKRQVKRYLEIR